MRNLEFEDLDAEESCIGGVLRWDPPRSGMKPTSNEVGAIVRVRVARPRACGWACATVGRLATAQLPHNRQIGSFLMRCGKAVTKYHVYVAEDLAGKNRYRLGEAVPINAGNQLQIPMGTKVRGIRYFLVYTANDHGEQSRPEHGLLIDDWTPTAERAQAGAQRG